MSTRKPATAAKKTKQPPTPAAKKRGGAKKDDKAPTVEDTETIETLLEESGFLEDTLDTSSDAGSDKDHAT
eukprot:7849543-Karenia_brevis.AAC.1